MAKKKKPSVTATPVVVNEGQQLQKKGTITYPPEIIVFKTIPEFLFPELSVGAIDYPRISHARIQISPDGKYFGLRNYDKTIAVWESDRFHQVATLPQPSKSSTFSFSSLNTVYFGTALGVESMSIFDKSCSLTLVSELKSFGQGTFLVNVSPRGNYAVVEGLTAKPSLINTNKNIQMSIKMSAGSDAFVWSEDEKVLVVSEASRNLTCYDLVLGQVIGAHKFPSRVKFDVSGDGKLCATYLTQTIQLWETNTMKSIAQFYHNSIGSIISFNLHPDGTKIAVLEDKKVIIYSVSTNGICAILCESKNIVLSDPLSVARFHPTKPILLSASMCNIVVFDYGRRQEILFLMLCLRTHHFSSPFYKNRLPLDLFKLILLHYCGLGFVVPKNKLVEPTEPMEESPYFMLQPALLSHSRDWALAQLNDLMFSDLRKIAEKFNLKRSSLKKKTTLLLGIKDALNDHFVQNKKQ